jgi:diguanylate cyclase (GGDEF)-like protein/PAS domain S-box-containing protein
MGSLLFQTKILPYLIAMKNKDHKLDIGNNLRSSILYFSVFTCLLWSSGFVYLRHERNTLEELSLASQTTALDMAWKAVVKSYQTGMLAYFESHVMQPEVLKILRQAQGGSESEQAILRVKLYRLLFPAYKLLQKRGVRQLHFHTPDSRSFLRFHAPHYSGDSLVSSRPSVVMANRDHKEVQGFETGRVVAGFRNVFPLFDDGEHLGSVEISQPFEALRREMWQLDNSNNFLVVYNGALLLPKLLEEQKKVYAPSFFSPDWLVEDPKRKLSDSSPTLTGLDYEVGKELAMLPAFVESLSTSVKPRSVAVKVRGEMHKVTIIPLLDIEGFIAAVLFSFSPAPGIDEIYQSYHMNLLVFSAMTLFAGLALFLFLQSQQEIAAKERNIKLITNTIVDGLYVMNNQGVITFVNKAASEHLGYSRDELLGQVAHTLFHFHDFEFSCPLEECPIFKVLRDENSYIGEEVFRCKDGTSFIVEVASEAMFKNGRVTGSVTIFRDISSRKQAEIYLQEAHDKMDLLSNNIETQVWSLMSVDTYGAVNHAHAEFCGLSPEAMEYKTFFDLFPRDIAEVSVENNQAVFAGKDQIRTEEWVYNGRGERRLLSMIRTPKLSAEGKVEYVICSGDDITERKQMEEQLRELCNTDPLTRAFNRRYFLQVLESEVQRSQRYGSSFAVVMCDIDHFKKVNDVFGHETGDTVLTGIVNSIQERVRGADVFARWGGEEFVLLLANTSLTDAVPLVENIRENIRQLDFGVVRMVSVSFGVTSYRADDTVDTLLNRADNLLYDAKAAGRNCVRFSV